MAAVAGEGLIPGCALPLKGDVLALLLSHPGGIPLRDFGRLFQQHHGRRLDLPGHGYHSLRQLLGDMKELVVLDEEGEEPRVQCWHPPHDPRLGAEPPKRYCRHFQNHKEAPPKHQQVEIPKAAPRPWNSCHHLAPPTSTSPSQLPARSTPGHRPSVPMTRTVSLSCFPGSRLPVAVPWQLPLLTFGNQPLGLVACEGSPLNISAPAPSRLSHPASPQLDPASRSELERNVAQILRAHPRGISLFRFRQTYSATYSDSFPLDSSASVKEQLAAMPGTVRMEGWGVQTLLFPACLSEPPSTEKETGLSPSLLEASVPLISPAVVPVAPARVWPSPANSASPPEAQHGDAGCPGATPAAACPEQLPVPCSPPPGHGVALGASAELPTFPTASAAPCSPVSGLEHEAMGPFTTKTVMEVVAKATPTAGAVLSQLRDKLPWPLDLPPSAPLSSMGSSSVPLPSLSLYYVTGTDAILYGLKSAPSTPGCPTPELSFPPALPGPTSNDQSPLTMLSPEPAWLPMQGVPATTDSLRVKPPFRPLPLAEPSFASSYKQEDSGAPRAAVKPELHLLPLSPSHPPHMGSKGKPPKRRKDSCVLL